jgi:hypothetical protein
MLFYESKPDPIDAIGPESTPKMIGPDGSPAWYHENIGLGSAAKPRKSF